MEIVKKIKEGELLPPWYGVAWRDYHPNGAVCVLVPFNLVASAARSVYLFVKHGGRRLPMDPRAAYHQGVQDERRAAASLRRIDFDQLDAGYQPLAGQAVKHSLRRNPDNPGHIHGINL